MKSGEYSESFTTIAAYYDTLMSFINYPSWIAYIENILSLHSIKQRTLLDIACGTGVCLEHWIRRGYEVIGLDRSREMLQVARERFHRQNRDDIELIQADMRTFILPHQVPIVTCLYDSVNYLLTEADVRSCFERVYSVLDSGGIFIFDMNTVHCLRDEWGNTTFYRQDENINSVWQNSFDASTGISTLHITLKIHEDGTIRTVKEHHQERGYLLSAIGALLREAGFTFSMYRHLTFNPAWEDDLRIMGVAKK